MRAHPTLRQRTATLLEVGALGDRASRSLDFGLIALICLNVAAILAESVERIGQQYATAFRIFEIVSVVIFSLEYLLRVWSSPDIPRDALTEPKRSRIRFAMTPGALVDLIAILPSWLSMFFGIDLRILRVIRLLRVLKLTRYSATMQAILGVFRDEAQAFVATFCLLLVLLILTSSGIYILEHAVQPDAFGSIPEAAWWAMATLTTVGYGDVTPITPLGKFFGGCITLISIGVVALPAGILASGFTDMLRKNRARYGAQLASALEDGTITATEQSDLDTLREQLNLSREDVETFAPTFTARVDGVDPASLVLCPHCHQRLSAPATPIHPPTH